MTLIKNIVLEDVIKEDTRRSEDERRDQTQNIMDLYIKTVRLQQKDIITVKNVIPKDFTRRNIISAIPNF